MMPAANQGLGMNMGFPDVCTTPAAPAPIPIPYPNIGMNAMSVPFIPNIMVSMAPAHNMGAKPALTNGDNAGVAHPLFMQPGGTTMGNPRIMMGGMPAAHLAVPTYGNNFNNPAGSKLVPSITNVLLGFRTAIAPTRTASPALRLQTERSTTQHLAAGILGLHIPCISLRCDRWLEQWLSQLRGSSVRGLVLDLRDNPGGSVVAAQQMAALLLHSNFAIAIATNAQTASAAELLAASLQGRPNTQLFGDTTYGKTTANYHWCSENWLQASDAASTTMRSLDQQELNPRGVRPDAFTEPRDTLRQAVQWLQRKLS